MADKEKNKDTVLAALKDMGIGKVVVTYEGSGDSGQIEGVELVPRNGLEAMQDAVEGNVFIERDESNYVDGQGFVKETKEVEVDIKEAVEDLCYDLLAQSHPGWEINEGSSGEFTFDVRAEKISLTHNNYYMESETTENEW